MDKLKQNPRLVVTALIAAGIVALIAGGGSDKNKDNVAETNKILETTKSATTDQPATQPNSSNSGTDTVIGSTPEAGPVEVKKAETSYSATVRKGDNQTVIVRQMINNFLKDNSKGLSAEQRLYAETVVVDSLPRNNKIFAGQEIKVDSSVISSAVEKSEALTTAQLARWSKYL